MIDRQHRVRFEQGLEGGRAVTAGDGVLIVVVDVLSFSTCVAVAEHCAHHLERSAAASVAVIAAGERWGDDSLRPALEDVWGAGAVLAALEREDLASPDALAAADAYRAGLARGLPLQDLPSGRELIEAGFAEDVEIAAERDASDAVPVLVGPVFSVSQDAPSSETEGGHAPVRARRVIAA